MPNRTPLTARASELMLDLLIVAEHGEIDRVVAIAREAAAVFDALDLERLDAVYALNHGRGRTARDRR